MRKIKDFLARPKTKRLAIPLAILILFGLAFAFQPVKVRVGERLKCKYGEIIEDNTKLVTLPRIFSPFYGVKTSKTTCAKHRTCERLYADALRNIAQGDLKTAGITLNTIQKRDPEYKDVNKKIKEVNKELVAAGQSPITTGSGTSGSSSSGEQTSGGNGSSGNNGAPEYTYLLDLLPDEISGYILTGEDWRELSATRNFKPKGSSIIKLLTLEVELQGNEDSANDYINNFIKRQYSGDKDENVEVKGRKCYFGTSTNQFAILVWQRGGIVYMVEMFTSKEPEKLKSDLIEIAKKID